MDREAEENARAGALQPTLPTSNPLKNTFETAHNEFKKRRSQNQEPIRPPHDMKVFLPKKSNPIGFHRDLFMMASPIFSQILLKEEARHVNRYPSLRLTIPPSMFRIVKDCIYGNSPSSSVTDLDTALEALEIGRQYQITAVEDTISQLILDKMLTPDHACKILKETRSYQCAKIRPGLLQYIWRNGEACLKSDDFCQLGSFDVLEILASDDLCCGEEQVFQAAVRWAEARSVSSSNPNKSRKYYFHEIMGCIRFTFLTPSFLAQETANQNLIDSDELVQIFQNLCLPEELKDLISLRFEKRSRNYVSFTSYYSPPISTEDVPKEPDESVLVPREIMPPPPTPAKFKQIEDSPIRVTRTGLEDLLLQDTLPPPVKKRKLRGSVVSFSSEVSVSDGTTESITNTSCVSGDDDDSDDFYSSIRKTVRDRSFPVFEDFVKRLCTSDKLHTTGNVSELRCCNVTLQDNYRTVFYGNNFKEARLVFNCKFLENDPDCRTRSFLNFIRHFDIMRYLALNKEATGGKGHNVEHIWGWNIDITLQFEGVTFLNIQHPQGSDLNKGGGTLIMNYLPDSAKILSNEKLRPKKLALSNCEFNLDLLRNKGKQLEELILHRVWGDYTMDEILKEFNNLQELTCWRYAPPLLHLQQRYRCTNCNSIKAPFSPILSFNFAKPIHPSARTSLRKLVLCQSELKFATRSNCETNITELFLDRCYTVPASETTKTRGPKVSEVFHLVFPKLEKFVIIEDSGGDFSTAGNAATPELIHCVLTKISNFQFIRVVGLKWSENNEDCIHLIEEEGLLMALLISINLPGKPRNFLLQKSSEGEWTGESMNEEAESQDVDGGYWSKMDEMEFHWYGLNNFYEKCEVFEDYFLQDDNSSTKGKDRFQFPRPILWV